jgi:hypothetical protein
MVEAQARGQKRSFAPRRVAVAGIALSAALLTVSVGDSLWSLRRAEEEAATAARLLEAGRLEAAAERFRASEGSFGRSARSLALLETVAGWVPIVSGNVRLAHAEAEAGRAASAAGSEVSSALASLASARSVLGVRPLREAGPALSGAAADLDRSLGKLGRTEAGAGTLAPLADARPELLAAGALLLRAASGLHAVAALARPGRRYLVIIQNPAELRATGGLIGAWGVLATDGERFRLTRLAPNSKLPVPPAAVPAPPDYVARYGRFGANRGWVNANISPDFPTSARVLLELYRAATGDGLDGVVALDAVALDRLLGATGPLTLAGREVAQGAFLSEVLVHAYGRPTEARVDLLLGAAREGWRRLGAGAEPLSVARALARAGATGHLRGFALERDAQASLVAAGVGGRLERSTGDYLLVVRQNAGGNKLDYYLKTRVAKQVTLDRRGNARSRLKVELRNQAPRAGLPSYVLGVRRAGEPAGLNRSYVSVYAAPRAELMRFRSGTRKTAGSAQELGHRVFSWYQGVPAGGRRAATLALSSPAVAERNGEEWTYRLLLQGQPELYPPPTTVTVELPAGARVRSALGPNVQVDGSRVRFHALLDRDRSLSVTYCLCPHE